MVLVDTAEEFCYECTLQGALVVLTTEQHTHAAGADL